MKRITGLLLSAAMLAAMLTGCGCSSDRYVPETTVPLATVRPTTEPTRETVTRPTLEDPYYGEPTETIREETEGSTNATIEDGNGPLPSMDPKMD